MAHPEEKVSAAYVAAFAVWATGDMKAAFVLGAEAEFEQNQAQEAQASDHATEDATSEPTPDDEADDELDKSAEEEEEEEEE
ncbi:hypothetical protein BO99DRAFT_406600 [Aspergillus violaceofuscus CBS 115571]|uniref:Uncharacterized protein n=2 Tax=Aspergillus TaxID=5052 RepID=A0A2V5GTN5_ASPV1|nr:hypothetical protein BO99DRAFT_406600 [Aspergillus violaceofuscus CBS 115571]